MPAACLPVRRRRQATYDAAIRATDVNGQSDRRDYAIVVTQAALQLPATMLLDAQSGVSYFARLQPATGGAIPYTYALTAGALPAAMTVTPDGTLRGIPDVAGTYTFEVTVIDSDTVNGPSTASQQYALIVITPPTLTLSPAVLQNASTGRFYVQAFSASGGTAPYLYRLSAGALPPGVQLVGNLLAGTPITGGTYSFAITVTDRTLGVPLALTRTYTVVVEQPLFEIDEAVPAVATAGRIYSYGIQGRGGISPYTYRVDSGALPSGLAMGSDGNVSGTPTAAGTFDVTVVGTDSASGTPATATRSFRFVVELPVMTVSPDRPQPAAVGADYSMSIGAAGGKEPYLYTVTSGTLPAGLQLSSSGSISGVPEVTGSFEITITATDSSSGYGPITGSRAYTLVVEPPRLVLDTRVLPIARGGEPYTAKILVSNGVAPYTFTFASGTFPPGLTLGDDGTISGIPERPSLHRVFRSITLPSTSPTRTDAARRSTATSRSRTRRYRSRQRRSLPGLQASLITSCLSPR